MPLIWPGGVQVKLLPSAASDSPAGTGFGSALGKGASASHTAGTQAPQRRPQLMVGDDTAIGAGGGFNQLDAVVLDGRRPELFGHALPHVAGGLADLQQARVGRRVDGIGVQPRAELGPVREDVLDRPAQSAASIGRIMDSI